MKLGNYIKLSSAFLDLKLFFRSFFEKFLVVVIKFRIFVIIGGSLEKVYKFD